MPNKLITSSRTTTIASGGTTSTPIEVEDLITYGLAIPTLTSGTVKIQGSVDGSTYQDIYDEFGNQVLLFGTAANPTTGAFSVGRKGLEHIAGFSNIQFVTSVAQGSARTFTLYFRDTER